VRLGLLQVPVLRGRWRGLMFPAVTPRGTYHAGLLGCPPTPARLRVSNLPEVSPCHSGRAPGGWGRQGGSIFGLPGLCPLDVWVVRFVPPRVIKAPPLNRPCSTTSEDSALQNLACRR